MAVDSNGQPINAGDTVIIRARVEEVFGDVLHLRTLEPTSAYPQGSRINLQSSQVERVEIESEQQENSDEEKEGEKKKENEEPKFEEMTKADLVDFGISKLDLSLPPNMGKDKMIVALREALAAKSTGSA